MIEPSARAAVQALQWNILVPDNRIQVIVEDGWITLKGEVDWYFQKEEAERTVRNLTGVRGVSNLLTVAAKPTPTDIKKRITEALQRGAQFDAERAARNVPGVTEVENRLTVDPGVSTAV